MSSRRRRSSRRWRSCRRRRLSSRRSSRRRRKCIGDETLRVLVEDGPSGFTPTASVGSVPRGYLSRRSAECTADLLFIWLSTHGPDNTDL